MGGGGEGGEHIKGEHRMRIGINGGNMRQNKTIDEDTKRNTRE